MTIYYTPAEVAEWLDVSPKTIRQEIRLGRLQAQKINTIYRISGDQLDAWIEKTRVDPSMKADQ